jgi:hypothetical protein
MAHSGRATEGSLLETKRHAASSLSTRERFASDAIVSRASARTPPPSPRQAFLNNRSTRPTDAAACGHRLAQAQEPYGQDGVPPGR